MDTIEIIATIIYFVFCVVMCRLFIKQDRKIKYKVYQSRNKIKNN